MRHHFIDWLEGEHEHWCISPNRDRCTQDPGDAPEGSLDVEVATIGRGTEGWQRVLTFPNLIELTLHEPSREQFEVLPRLPALQRLRITHFRPKHVEVLASLGTVEELVLEYVSGFEDLSPVGRMPRLRSLFVENLRRVHDFSGLAGRDTLRYLQIHGTVDWKQPIDDWEFVRGLPSLGVLRMCMVKCRADFPATLPIVDLPALQRLEVSSKYLPSAECALLEEGLPDVEGARFGPWRKWGRSYMPMPADDPRSALSDDELRAEHPDVSIDDRGRRRIPDPDDTWYLLSGTETRDVKVGTGSGERRAREFAVRYEQLREQARALLAARRRA